MKCSINVVGKLDESLYHLYVSSNMFHPTCKSILSFDVKSKMVKDMHLPVILSELVEVKCHAEIKCESG